MKLRLCKGGGLAEPPFADTAADEHGDTLHLYSGRLLRPPNLSVPFLCWDGHQIVSNLPGTGLSRRFYDLTIHCYHQLWHSPAPASTGRGLWLPSYALGQASYCDGPVLGRLGTDGPKDFMLPLGRYTYEGPLAEANQAPAELTDQLSPRSLRAPLSQAVAAWLRPRYAPKLCTVTVDHTACPRRQALALIYLKMAGFFSHLAVAELPVDLDPNSAKGFRALARNLGCYFGKAQPPAELVRCARLSLADLSFFVAEDLIAATIADFNAVSPLVPKALQEPA